MESESSNSTQAVTLSNTNPDDPLLVQSSPRRFSLDATTAHSNYDDNASLQQSAFYLKHQNRAPATELKSYQYSLSELLQERTIRRSHCFKIFQSVQHLVNVWKMIENAVISADDPNHRRKRMNDAITTHSNKIGNDVVIDNGIASTGTEDSIEWTSALYKTLMELGKCALPAEPDSLRQPIGQNMNGNKMTESDGVGTSSSNAPLDDTDIDASYHYTEAIADHYTEAIAANISSRAKLLQEWLQRIVETKQPMSYCDDIMNDTSERTQSVALQELSTRCATHVSQITELELN